MYEYKYELQSQHEQKDKLHSLKIYEIDKEYC